MSCFFNKFIVKKGAVNAILSLEKSLCVKIDDFSFKQLCENYLPLIHQNPQAVNPHLYPLAFHLLPIKYTHAVKMSDLYNAMNELLGLDIASRCFKQPVNNSSTSGLIDAPSGTDWTERDSCRQTLRNERPVHLRVFQEKSNDKQLFESAG